MTKKIIIETLLRFFGGQKILSKKISEALPLTPLNVVDIQNIIPAINSLASWKEEWEMAGIKYAAKASNLNNSSDAKVLYRKASAMFQFAMYFLHTESPEKEKLESKVVEIYKKFGRLEGEKFEVANIKYNETSHISGYFQRPNIECKVPAVLIITHLGGIKEELDFMSTYFLEQGFATLRIDLPGSGESSGRLPLNAENICSEAITFLCNKSNVLTEKIVSIGISFGAYWTMRTAAIDARVKVAIGISTPVVFGKHWSKFPKSKWILLKKSFGKNNIHSTKKVGKQLTLSGVMEKIQCPIVLFHGEKDKLTHPNTMNLLLQDINSSVYKYTYPKSGHGCKDNLFYEILPLAVEKSKDLLGLQRT